MTLKFQLHKCRNIATPDWLTKMVTSAAGDPAGQKGDVLTYYIITINIVKYYYKFYTY